MQPVVFALETKENGIDIESYINWPDSVLLDIDASYVVESRVCDFPLPPFPNEIEFMKILNRIKNKMLDHYDKIYFHDNIPLEIDQENMKVNSIREIFFNIMMPFITPAYQSIQTNVQNPKNMDDYFDLDYYLMLIEDYSGIDRQDKYIAFAKQLTMSGSFSQFMDGYLQDDVMNFDLVNSILCFRGQLSKRYKAPSVSLR